MTADTNQYFCLSMSVDYNSDKRWGSPRLFFSLIWQNLIFSASLLIFVENTIYYETQDEHENYSLMDHNKSQISLSAIFLARSILCLSSNNAKTVLRFACDSCFIIIYGCWIHYENAPIQIYWNFHHKKSESFQIKILIFFIFLLKT